MGDKIEQKRKEQEFLAASSNYAKGTHLFLTYLRVQLLLLRSERVLAETLLPEKLYPSTFAKIAAPAFAHFTEMSDALIRALRRNPNKIYCTSAYQWNQVSGKKKSINNSKPPFFFWPEINCPVLLQLRVYF